MNLPMRIAPDPEPPKRQRDHDAMLESLLRHWNRVPRAVRIDAAELIAASHGDEIEP